MATSWRLEKIDRREIPSDPAEIILVASVRDEILRLPFFLQYYTWRGINRFIFVDNGSTDGTTDLLLSRDFVHVFRTDASFSAAQSGIEWVRSLLDTHCRNHWCVCVDADELLVYPGWERLTLRNICDCLDEEGATAAHFVLVDMYSNCPFAETTYSPGTDPLLCCRYFESDTIMCAGRLPEVMAGRMGYFGGMRMRVFGLRARLDKYSLFRHTPPMLLQRGMHNLENCVLSRVGGAVLHFKYFSDFPETARLESARGEHWSDGSDYKCYEAALSKAPDLTAYCKYSRVYSHSSDLVRCGLMRSTPELERQIRAVSTEMAAAGLACGGSS